LIYDLRFTIYGQTEKVHAFADNLNLLLTTTGSAGILPACHTTLDQKNRRQDASAPRLIAEQFLQLLSRGAFARIAFGFRRPFAQGEFKILAKVAHVLFQHRFGPTFPALVGRPRIVVRAVQADAQISPAFHADFTAPGLAVQRPRLAAIVAVTRHLRFMIDDL
jgi:hypothetical protein